MISVLKLFQKLKKWVFPNTHCKAGIIDTKVKMKFTHQYACDFWSLLRSENTSRFSSTYKTHASLCEIYSWNASIAQHSKFNQHSTTINGVKGGKCHLNWVKKALDKEHPSFTMKHSINHEEATSSSESYNKAELPPHPVVELGMTPPSSRVWQSVQFHFHPKQYKKFHWEKLAKISKKAKEKDTQILMEEVNCLWSICR